MRRVRVNEAISVGLVVGLLIVLAMAMCGCSPRRPVVPVHEDIVQDDDVEEAHTAADVDRVMRESLAHLKARHAHWDGVRFICPPETDVWVDEEEAMNEGRNFVYCVEAKPRDIER
jgi:hypothetical protein